MSYSVYTTSGFILGSAPSGEANKVYALYTRDFGLVRASAQGVRHLKSKLRYNLGDFGRASFSLVRGRETWRLTGAVAEPAAEADRESAAMRARVLTLVKRLVQGEERNDALFAALESLFGEGTRATGDDAAFETLALARVLSALGYVDLAAVEAMPPKERIRAVNKALKETHL